MLQQQNMNMPVDQQMLQQDDMQQQYMAEEHYERVGAGGGMNAMPTRGGMPAGFQGGNQI